MKTGKITAIILICFYTLRVNADQLQCLDKDSAHKAKAFLEKQKSLIIWCACCDKNSEKTFVHIDSIKIDSKPCNYQLTLYGKSKFSEKYISTLDLAYVYSNKGKLGVNVGLELGFKCDPCSKPFVWKEYLPADTYWLPRTRKDYEFKLSLFATEVDLVLNDSTKELFIKDTESRSVYFGKHYTNYETSIDQDGNETFNYFQSDSTLCHCIKAPFKNHPPTISDGILIGVKIKGYYYWAKQAHFSVTGENGINQTSTLSPNFLTDLNAYCMFLKENGTIRIDYMEFEGKNENGVPAKYFIKNICVQYK